MSPTATRTPKTKAASKTMLPSKAVARAPAVGARAKRGDGKAKAGPALSAQERERLIAQAAYFRAEKRGFAPGCELQDWVEAEAEVRRLIGNA
ncbi:MAG TPA: DUF2934 domain-containing protein [Burkholderiales bacterium]|nr:DUF2934 domain-containing protein [Burkholderiales bacterium]